jgi:putative transposase
LCIQFDGGVSLRARVYPCHISPPPHAALAAEVSAIKSRTVSIPPRPVHSGTFLVTTATYNRRRLFQVIANCDLFVETLQHYRRQGHYLLHDFVVMPEHVHLLLTPQNITLERAVGLIKGGFSHRLGSKFPVWQRSFTDQRARDREGFLAARRYIHMNPVEERMCETPEDYKWSSAWKGAQRPVASE